MTQEQQRLLDLWIANLEEHQFDKKYSTEHHIDHTTIWYTHISNPARDGILCRVYKDKIEVVNPIYLSQYVLQIICTIWAWKE